MALSQFHIPPPTPASIAAIHTIAITDSEYPEALKKLEDPPQTLFVRGNLPTMPCISVVGTRKMTNYGIQCIEHLLPPLMLRGLGIISGLAFGVDITAHKLALSKKSYTLAVLPSGLDAKTIYPSSHQLIARQILERGGGLVSEYEPSLRPQKHMFLERNRIIAALGVYTLVIEAPFKSGALSTAAHAFKLGKPVGAVPGSIFSENSGGTHSVIQKGGQLVHTASDILNAVGISLTSPGRPENRLFVGGALEHDPILSLFKGEPQSAETIAHLAQKSVSEVFVALTALEMNHMVKQLPDGRYMPIMV